MSPQTLVLALTFAVSAVHTAADDRSEREAFLREADVVDMALIGTGITLPQNVRLERSGVSGRAVFKSVDIELERERFQVGREIQVGIHDSWKYEVAAYELDKLLDLGLVPVTVERRIEGQDGALIDWIDGAMSEFEVGPEGLSLEDWRDQIATVWLFDYLAYNIDRTPDNLLVVGGFQARLIDHSRSFQLFLVPMHPLSRFPKGVIERLRALTEDELRAALGEYLGDESMTALLERRTFLLERVERLVRENGESEVLF